MIINPGKIVEQGILYTAEGCEPFNPDLQIQQAGIDLRVNKVFLIKGLAVMCEDKKNKKLPEYFELPLDQKSRIYQLLPKHAYGIDMMEEVSVPNNMVAFIIHRSSFNRSGAMIWGSVYDPGFHGVVGATIYPHTPLALERGSRVAQIVFMPAEAYSIYQGSYQHQAGQQGFEKLGEKQ